MLKAILRALGYEPRQPSIAEEQKRRRYEIDERVRGEMTALVWDASVADRLRQPVMEPKPMRRRKR